MPVVMINKHNINEHTKKVKVIQRFRHGGRAVLPGEVITVAGHVLYDLLSRKLVEYYTEPEPEPVILNDSEESPKRTRKRKSK